MTKEEIQFALEHLQTIVPKETVVKVLEELKQKHLEELTKTSFGFYLVEDLNKALELIHEEKKSPIVGFPTIEIPRAAIAASKVQPEPPLESPRKQAVHKRGKKSVSKRV